MRVLVFGAGAVGLGLGSALLAAGARVRFVGRPQTVAALREQGLRRTGLFGCHEAPPAALDAAAALAELPPDPADFVLVATKSFATEEAAREIAAHPHAAGAASPVVLCQNGWGHAERAARFLGEARVWNARVITGFRRPAPGHVDVTVHAEPVRVGSLFGADPAALAPLCAAIDRGGIPCETTPRIAFELWAKVLYNAVLNPLGAVLGVAYGRLGESPETRRVMRDLARETFAVMEAAGCRTHWETADDWLRDFHARLLPPTAEHESSMLQDLRAGRRTEIDALTGEVVRLGEASGVAVPVSRTLLALVRFAEAAGKGAPRRRAGSS